MTNKQFSERIKQLRIEKGYSQSELAGKTGLTVRSIQRLEKGENTPRGDTLKRICDVFEIPVESLVVKEQSENLFFLMLISLSPLVFLIHPVLGVIPPLFLWLYKRKSIKDVDHIGRKVLNFQLSWGLIYWLVPLLSSALRFLFNKQFAENYLIGFLLKEIFLYSMLALNVIVIILSTFFMYRSGKPRLLYGFAFNKLKIRPVIIALYILLLGILMSGIIFPRKNYIEMEKAKVVRFAKEAIQIKYQADGSHTDSLKQYLNPLIDSSRTSAILHGMFIPWGEVESNFIEIKDHGFSRNGSLQSHFLHILYTDTRSHRLFRYLLQIDKIDGQYYISDYFSEDMADTFFKKVELKKKQGYLFWKVSGPMGTKIFKNHQLKDYGRMTYRKLRELNDGKNTLYYMEDGKLKKERMKNSRQ